MAKKKASDWRSLPRKPAHLKRDQPILIRLTANEMEQFREGAVKADRTLVDWVVMRCLGKNAR